MEQTVKEMVKKDSTPTKKADSDCLPSPSKIDEIVMSGYSSDKSPKIKDFNVFSYDVNAFSPQRGTLPTKYDTEVSPDARCGSSPIIEEEEEEKTPDLWSRVKTHGVNLPESADNSVIQLNRCDQLPAL